MAEIHILQDLVLLFGLSVLAVYLCHVLKLPSIIGYLVTGLAIGPYGFGLISSLEGVETLAEIGVVLLLFTIGIEFSVRDLVRSWRAVVLGGALQVVLTIGVTFLLVTWLGLPANQAVFAGFLISLSSTAVVLRSLQDRGDLDSAHGRTILSILIFQDVAIAPMVIFTPILAENTGALGHSLIMLAVKGLAIVVAVVLLARYVVPQALHMVARTRSRELFLVCTVLICVAIAWATGELGLSLGLGAFIAGLVISESEYSFQALEGILPFKAVFTSFFFVSVGMLLDTSVVMSQPTTVLATAVVVMVVKAVLAGGVALALGMSSRAAVITGLALSQIGEFSFILSKVGETYGLLGAETYQIFLAVSIITMGVTPLIISVSPRIADAAAAWPGLRLFKEGSYYWMTDSTDIPERLSDHLIIIGFGLNGQNIARAARAGGVAYVTIEMNPDSVRQFREQGEPIMYGDATSAGLLRQAGATRARVVVVAISDAVATRRITDAVRRLNATTHIIVRTRFVAETAALYELGASDVIPEEFETSVEIFNRVLARYLIPRDQIERFTSEIRSRGYEMFRSPSGRGPTTTDLQLRYPELEINAVTVAGDSNVVGRTLAEAELRRKLGISVLAVLRGARLIPNPAPQERLEAGDILYVIGNTEQCAQAARIVAEEGKD